MEYMSPALLTAWSASKDAMHRSVSEHELWACALAVDREHGCAAPQFVAERVGALALAADWEGVEVCKKIAMLLDQLYRTGTAN